MDHPGRRALTTDLSIRAGATSQGRAPRRHQPAEHLSHSTPNREHPGIPKSP